MSTDIDPNEVNQQTYTSGATTSRYQDFNDLFAGEIQMFANNQATLKGRVLDIGIGAGRTTQALAADAKTYVGIDLAAPMVQIARSRFPELDLREMDMRDVPAQFAGEQFDTILISFNSIDYIPWADREPLLVGLRKLLQSSGVLMISTHSLEHLHRHPVRLRPPRQARPQPSTLLTQPVEYAKQCVRLLGWLARAPKNHLRLRKHEVKGRGYAIVNDSGEHFSLLTAYVDEPTQRDQLAKAGFSVTDRIGGDRPNGDAFFHYYVAHPAPKPE